MPAAEVKTEDVQAVLDEFNRNVAGGHPWLPGAAFIKVPGLDDVVKGALEEFLRVLQVHDRSKPARRVSLSDDPNWRPSSVAPVLPGSKEWVDREGDAGVADPLG